MKIQNNLSERQMLEGKIKTTRTNLLLVVLFTAINIVLLVTQSNSYFLFSAYIPYALIDIGMYFCGMYPAEIYGEDYSSLQFVNSSFFMVLLIVALIIMALYLASWFFSKKNKVGWFIFALIFFVIDTLGMFYFLGFSVDNIIDIVFHIWVIVSLALGINACVKLKKMPTEAHIPEIKQEDNNLINSVPIRVADLNVKSRKLLESNVLGHTVTYRRVKKTNELIIDGNVYAEMEGAIELDHSLSAQIDGHLIEVGFDGRYSRSYLNVDGQTVAKKLRIF